MTIKALDGLRGLAVLLVLLSHLSLFKMNLLAPLDFSGIGKAGVYLFFVLSAFLLTRLAFQAMARKQATPRYWAGYLLRRFCRIYPLYALVLVVSLFAASQLNHYIPAIPDPGTLLKHLLLLQGENIYWAIPVEFKYYLVLPAVTLILVFCQGIHMLLAVGIAVAGTIATTLVWPPADAANNAISLGPYLGIFLLGSLAAILCETTLQRQSERGQQLITAAGWLAVAGALLTIPSLWRLISGDSTLPDNYFHRDFLFYGVGWSIAVLAAVHGHLWFRWIFETAAARHLGRISFSVYLWHLLVIQLVSQFVVIYPTLQFLLVMAATLLLSHLSYRFIERPFITWSHKLTDE